jgi:hypothetical protein
METAAGRDAGTLDHLAGGSRYPAFCRDSPHLSRPRDDRPGNSRFTSIHRRWAWVDEHPVDAIATFCITGYPFKTALVAHVNTALAEQLAAIEGSRKAGYTRSLATDDIYGCSASNSRSNNPAESGRDRRTMTSGTRRSGNSPGTGYRHASWSFQTRSENGGEFQSSILN